MKLSEAQLAALRDIQISGDLWKQPYSKDVPSVWFELQRKGFLEWSRWKDGYVLSDAGREALAQGARTDDR